MPMVSLKPVQQDTSIILSEIRDEIRSEKPLGQTFNLRVDVTDRISDLYDQYRHKLPWSKVDITNLGPNPVYFGVNTWDWPEAPLGVGESINIDFQRQNSIQRLYLKCDAGLSTTVTLQIMK